MERSQVEINKVYYTEIKNKQVNKMFYRLIDLLNLSRQTIMLLLFCNNCTRNYE